MYLALGRAFRLSLLGVFSMPIVFLFQLFAILYLGFADPGPRPPERLDPWLELHAAMSLLAYGAFGLAGIAGVMYLIQDRQLKSHKPGRLFYSHPRSATSPSPSSGSSPSARSCSASASSPRFS